MKVLLAGFVPAEGRMSMVRTARTLHAALQPLLGPGDSAGLLDDPAAVGPTLKYRDWRVKVQKRLLYPWRLHMARCDALHIVDSDYAAAIPKGRLEQSIVTCHDLMPLLLGKPLEEIFSRPGLRLFHRSLHNMARAARVVCVSAFTRRCVLDHTDCDPARVSVIPQAVEPHFRPLAEESVAAFRHRHGLGPGPFVLHVGSAEPYKNIETLLAVVGHLRRAVDPAVRLLKVGGHFSPEHHRTIERAGLRNTIDHLTGLDEEDLVAAYSASALLLWPSHFEGFGWPVLEAMACGLPVVCSNGGSLPEVAGDAAAVCAPEDLDGLVQACADILESPDTVAALRARGIKQAAAFSWKRTAEAYLQVYREVATGTASPR